MCRFGIRRIWRELSRFQDYYNRERVHPDIGGDLPTPNLDDATRSVASLDNYR